MEHEASIPSSPMEASADMSTELASENTNEAIRSKQLIDAVNNEEDTGAFEIAHNKEDVECDLEVKAVAQQANLGFEKCDDTQVIKKEDQQGGIDWDNESEIPSTLGSTVPHEKSDDLPEVEKAHDGNIIHDDMITDDDERKINTEPSSIRSAAQNVYVDIPIKSPQTNAENIMSGRKEVDHNLDSNIDASDKTKSLHIQEGFSGSHLPNTSVEPDSDQVTENVLESEVGKTAAEKRSSESFPNTLSEESTKEGYVEKMQSDNNVEEISLRPTEKHVDEAKVQCKVINVYISWKDIASENETVLEWIHQNCSDCKDKFDDWKTHVLENHKIGNCKSNGTKDIGSKDSLSTDTQKKDKTVVKMEVPDDEMSTNGSQLIVTIPRLTLKSKGIKKRGRKPQKMTKKQSPPKIVKQKATKVAKSDQTPKIKVEDTDSENDDADGLQNWEMEVPNVNAPNKRKRGRPQKLVEEPTDPSDSDNSEKEDPDYQPDELRPKGTQNKRRPGRPKKFPTAPPKIYECSHGDCSMSFNKFRECKKHEKEAHKVEFRCKFEGCEMVFKTALKKNKHEVDKHGGLYECEHCDLTFTNKKERTAHKKTHVSFKCEYENCGKSYAMEEYLKVHQKTHYADKSHICPVCTKGFISGRYLNRHMKTHTERSHQCDSCDKSFKTPAALEKHRRRHTGEGLLVCQFCGKKLNGIVSLQRHERVHTGDKPFHCKFCDKRFVCQGSLQSHEQEHTGLQFICEKCGKKFKTKGNLQEHERIHTGEKPCKCKFCGKSYAAGSSLWKHVTSRHSGFKRYKCEVCGKLFARYNGLAKHKTVHTGIRNYECKYCHKMFTTSSIRRGHYKQVHLGIKRTGHQGRAKKIKEETIKMTGLKQEGGDQKLYIDETKDTNSVQAAKMLIDQSGSSSSGTSQTTAHPSTGPPPTGRRIPGVHQLIPIDFSRDRRPGIPPHVMPLDPSRSDFYTMVDSLIQFSKEH